MVRMMMPRVDSLVVDSECMTLPLKISRAWKRTQFVIYD